VEHEVGQVDLPDQSAGAVRRLHDTGNTGNTGIEGGDQEAARYIAILYNPAITWQYRLDKARAKSRA